MFEKYFKTINISIFLVTFLFIISKPIENLPDSNSYLAMEINRSPIYPIFLWIIKYVFNSYFNIATIIFQGLFGIFSINFFVINLKKKYTLKPVFYSLLTIILIVPYFLHSYNIANRFLSEALSYPLYLLVVSCFLSFLITQKSKYLFYSIPFLFLLILTRNQFLFLIPIGVILQIWFSIKHKSFKNNIVAITIFILLPIFTSISDKTYHYFVHNHFTSTPWTGIHLIAPALYVSNQNDYKTFNTNQEQVFFKYIYAELHKNYLNINNLDLQDSFFDETTYYISNHSKIVNWTIFDKGILLMDKSLGKNEKTIALDQLTKKMTFPLVIKNLKLWLKVYIKNFTLAFSNSKYLLLYILLFIFGLVGTFKTNNDVFKIINFISLLAFFNAAFIAIGVSTIKRFTFYNDWGLFLIVFILMNSFLEFKFDSKEK